MQEAFRVGAPYGDLVVVPQRARTPRCAARSSATSAAGSRVVGAGRGDRAQVGDVRRAAARGPRRGSSSRAAGSGKKRRTMLRSPGGGRTRRPCSAAGHRVLRQDVAAVAHHLRRGVVQPVQDQQQARGGRACGAVAGARRLLAGQVEEVVAFVARSAAARGPARRASGGTGAGPGPAPAACSSRRTCPPAGPPPRGAAPGCGAGRPAGSPTSAGVEPGAARRRKSASSVRFTPPACRRTADASRDCRSPDKEVSPAGARTAARWSRAPDRCHVPQAAPARQSRPPSAASNQ